MDEILFGDCAESLGADLTEDMIEFSICPGLCSAKLNLGHLKNNVVCSQEEKEVLGSKTKFLFLEKYGAVIMFDVAEKKWRIISTFTWDTLYKKI